MSETPREGLGDPPAGFEYIPRAPFINHVGPIYQATENAPGTILLGLRVAQVHANTMGLMHGGMAATLADSAMARSSVFLLKRRMVTLKMTMEYLDAIRIGDWLEIDGRLADHDNDFCHTTCELRVDGKPRVKAVAVFRLLRATPSA